MSPEFSPETIFISYSRQDGRAFAESFEQRLEQEAGVRSWRDLRSIRGDDIRPQVLRAIETTKHLVLILTHRALGSDWVRREWTHARLHGRVVSPVLADPSIKRSDLPDWIRRAEVFDIAEPERWAMLVQVLRGPGHVRRVPYMTGTLPDGFVKRPAEYEKLKQAVLSARRDTAVAVTTALRGAGGYGKTTLANQLCLDPEVRFEFSDGILRVEIGKERNDLIVLVRDLIRMLDPDNKRSNFEDINVASDYLGELIGEAHILLIIDDVWREAQLRPFLKGGSNCVRLITTRLPQVLPLSARQISVDEMRVAEAVELVSANLPVMGNPVIRQRMSALAERLGYWAQMLSIANAWMRGWVCDGATITDAINEFDGRLTDGGLTIFDPTEEVERNRSIRICVEASIQDGDPFELARFCELGILPEDEDVPLDAVEALWAETGGLNRIKSVDLARRFFARSLLQHLDLGKRTLRLHDNMIWYLANRIGPEGRRAAHASMIRALQRKFGDNWTNFPNNSAWSDYGWRFMIWHLREAGQDLQADQLLTNYAWIKAKLHARGAYELFASYFPDNNNKGVQLVGQAVGLSLPALGVNPEELPFQLFGRLGGIDHEAAVAVAARAREDVDFRPAPRWPSLTPAGTVRLRLLGHTASVQSAAFSPNGDYIITASMDRTARIWDAASGEELRVLQGHNGSLRCATFSPDGTCVLTASDDATARTWDAESGKEMHRLVGHTDRLRSATFSPDGTRVLTASNDATARIWDAESGKEMHRLVGHTDRLRSATFSPDGTRVLTGSNDRTARIWDASSGKEIRTLRAHQDGVWNAVFSPDGTRILTSSPDRTARIWIAETGEEICALRGHNGPVWNAVFSPDGAKALTVSSDQTARLWDTRDGREVRILSDFETSAYDAKFSPDGVRILVISMDTAEICNASGEKQSVLKGHHTDQLRSAMFSPDGTYVVTTSADQTAQALNCIPIVGISVRPKHNNAIQNLVFSSNGKRILAFSSEGVTCWDAAAGEHICFLGSKAIVNSAVFSMDGERFYTSSHRVGSISSNKKSRSPVYEYDVTVWDSMSCLKLDHINFQIARRSGYEFSSHWAEILPNSKRILIGITNGQSTAGVWDAISGSEACALRDEIHTLRSTAFSPDLTRVLTVDHSAIHIWNAASGEKIAKIEGAVALQEHSDKIRSAVFSSNGREILTISQSDMACIWSATSGDRIVTLDSRVYAAVFLDDATHILTASRDRSARIWDARSGAEIMRFFLDAEVTALAAQGFNVALGDTFGRIHVYETGKFLRGGQSNG